MLQSSPESNVWSCILTEKRHVDEGTECYEMYSSIQQFIYVLKRIMTENRSQYEDRFSA
jgi:hypothetical protein